MRHERDAPAGQPADGAAQLREDRQGVLGDDLDQRARASEVGRFVDLALKAKSQKIATLSLVPPLINTADPDIDLVHSTVAAAIDRAEGDAPPRPGPARRGETDADGAPTRPPSGPGPAPATTPAPRRR